MNIRRCQKYNIPFQLKCSSDLLCAKQLMLSTIQEMQRYNVSCSDLCSRQHVCIRSAVSEQPLQRNEGTNIKTAAMETQQFVRFFHCCDTKRHCQKQYVLRCSWEVPLIFCPVLTQLEFSPRIYKVVSPCKISRKGAQWEPGCSMLKDRQTWRSCIMFVRLSVRMDQLGSQ